jgi:hypothetical protein
MEREIMNRLTAAEGRHEDLRDIALMADGRIVLCGRLLSGGEGWMLRYLG